MITAVQPSDLPRIAPLASWYFKKCGLSGEFNVTSFVKTWSALIESGTGIIMQRISNGPAAALCSDLPGVSPVEAIGVIIAPDEYTGHLCAGTRFWYKEGAASLADGRLGCATQDCLAKRGVVRWYMTSLFDDQMIQRQTFLIKAGFFPVETHFCKYLM